jgi:site-specific DNA-methyltransferase (adenine-specific)
MDEKTRKRMASSERDDWGTPQVLFDGLDKYFGGFTLDPAANHKNAKCEKYFTKEEDGLAQSWEGEKVFCNPPYGNETKYWLQKGYEESLKDNLNKVFLVAARTDTIWFSEAASKSANIFFIKGRLTFEDGTGAPAFFPSAVIVFNHCRQGTRNIRWCNREFTEFW